VVILAGDGTGGFGTPKAVGSASGLRPDSKTRTDAAADATLTAAAVSTDPYEGVASPVPVAPALIAPAHRATVAQPVTLDWNNVTNAASYEVQVDNSSTIAAPFVANLTVTVSQATLTACRRSNCGGASAREIPQGCSARSPRRGD
jgi:hypothetical protein